MKSRQTDYGKGDFNRSNYKKFSKNFDAINWSIDLNYWLEHQYMKQQEKELFIDYINKRFDFPKEIIKGSMKEWNKLYREFKDAS